MEWTRATLGLPDDATVFATTADYRRITPEVQESWVRILAVVPSSKLLVHPFHDGQSSSQTAKRFCADFDRRLSAHGVADDRLVIMPEPFASRADVKAFLRVANVYLDTYPVGGASGLIDPLEIGLPVVVCEGESSRSRRGSALLRTLNLPELIATTGAEYEAIATRLAIDPVLRQACAGRVRQQMERTPVFLDTLAASDAFGDLIEKGYDELIEMGRAAFRANPKPLNAALSNPEADATYALSSFELAQKALRAAPGDTTARHALGRALLDAGRSGRAVTYLVAALQGGENNPGLWRDLAGALRADGKRNQAIEALESSLRLDPSQAEGWLMLIDLAESSGATDFARESLEALRANAPDNPDIPIIAARLGC
jgi:predicted O-linked N-acetylglucosamine transferase (SPINDLY family)